MNEHITASNQKQKKKKEKQLEKNLKGSLKYAGGRPQLFPQDVRA